MVIRLKGFSTLPEEHKSFFGNAKIGDKWHLEVVSLNHNTVCTKCASFNQCNAAWIKSCNLWWKWVVPCISRSVYRKKKQEMLRNIHPPPIRRSQKILRSYIYVFKIFSPENCCKTFLIFNKRMKKSTKHIPVSMSVML